MGDGRLVVADNAVGCVSVIDDCGRETRLLGTKSNSPGHLHLINAVYCTPSNDVIVADHRLQVGPLASAPDFNTITSLHELCRQLMYKNLI